MTTTSQPSASFRGLSPEQISQLAALHNRPTFYEAVILRADGERRLLGYLARHSVAGLFSAIHRHGLEIVAFLHVSDEARMQRDGKAVAVDGGGRIFFTGRTKRDVIFAGLEVQFIGDEK